MAGRGFQGMNYSYCLAAVLLVIISLTTTAMAKFVVEKNSLKVLSPDSIKGTYDSAIGNFGIPQYGGTMVGTAVYPKENQNGCKTFDTFNIEFKSKPGGLPNVVLVNRGDCYFALKVWNAQNAGAAAVLVSDDREEPLITMDSPEEDSSAAEYLQNITIPSALIEKEFGDKLKGAINKGDMVNINLDWRESVPHPDDRVEYELWTNSNDECGSKCDTQLEFVKNFKGAAQILEKSGYTQFTPHYITWYCPQAFTVSKQCKAQCINHGRYCAPDPEQDFSRGYDGKDVVLENLRQLCIFKVANESNRPWAWWDYVTDFHIRCPMKEKKYTKECAENVIQSLGLDKKKVETCMGDPNADAENPVLKQEQDAQVGHGSRGDVTILPTLIINNRQYRGKLDKGPVLKAICAGFQETTEPTVCLSDDMETNECLKNNGGCWQDKKSNITACKDTFRGRVCECPLVDGVQFKGDGYSNCEAAGPGRCKINTRTVAEGALIKLGSQGNLVLEDSDGTVVWSIGTGKSNGILMAKNGNFQIYNTTNSSMVSAGSNLVWQSWDHPTHTLLPGQALKRGQTLVSNSSATNTSAGSYKLVMEPGGLVLFYTSSIEEPYWSMGLQGMDYQGILKPCFYNSSSLTSEAVYTGQNLTVSVSGPIGKSSSTSSCDNGNQSLLMPPPGFHDENEYRFLRLDRDGSLRVYRLSRKPGQGDAKDWSTDFELDPSNKNCILPTACGPYGICDNGQCSCPGSGTVDEFNQIQNLDVTQGCYSSQGEPTCSQPSAAQHFMSLDGVDYYANDYLKPEANVSTVEKCRNLCNSSCSCTAAFFRSSSSSCYLAYGPLSSLKLAANQTYKAYIKVLNKLPRNVTLASRNSLSIGSVAGITLSSAAAALFLCLITILFLRRSRIQESVTDEEEIDPAEMEEEAFLKTLPGLPPRFTYHELKEATDNFSRKLGTGGFGSVYEGVLKDKTGVAVKKLDGPRQGYREFRAEVATIGSISHMNLVRLRGFCADSRQRLLVYELMENGSLEKWLFSGREDSRGCLTWEQRYNVAVGTARGLAYLHEQCREPIMHLDIKPQNILLDKSFMPKVSDFGMSKLLNDDMTQVVTAVRGTPGYLAPEWLRYSVATKKCDVYSFGMVLLELVSGRKNFDPSAADPRLCYFPAWAMLRALEGRYMDLVDKRLGDNSVDTEGVTRMTKVAFWCIQDNPNQRPWMSVALKMLEGEWDIPDAPMWLLQRGAPQFLEGYGYEPMEDADVDADGDVEEDDCSSLVGNGLGAGGSFGSVLTIPSTQIAAAR